MSKFVIAAVAALALGTAALAGALIAVAASDEEDDPTTTVVTAAQESPPADASTASRATEPTIDADDMPLGKSEAKRVADAAATAVGGGSVTEVSRSDDPGETYEVEVLTDRGEIDVALDQNLDRVRNLAYQD